LICIKHLGVKWSHNTGRPKTMALRTPSLITLLLMLPGVSACAPSAPSGERRGEALYATCAACHGEHGEGRAEYQAPAIAGLEAWYVRAQLDKFRSGARGAHPDDVTGLRMRPMARQLDGDEDVATVAAYVAALTPARPSPTLGGGDPSRGEALFAACAECHGADAAGNRERDAPPLRDASDWYLAAQLEKFREGIRGTSPGDVTGGQMRPMALGLADEQAVRDVVAYVVSLGKGEQQHAKR
jgi:cytochrome c553